MRALGLGWLALLASCRSVPHVEAPSPQPNYIHAPGLVCPLLVAPELPQAILNQEISGTVIAEAHVVNGIVTEVRIISGPEAFHEPIVRAMKQYKCASGIADLRLRQEFRFNAEPPAEQGVAPQ
jgi:hypothetical protein